MPNIAPYIAFFVFGVIAILYEAHIIKGILPIGFLFIVAGILILGRTVEEFKNGSKDGIWGCLRRNTGGIFGCIQDRKQCGCKRP